MLLYIGNVYKERLIRGQMNAGSDLHSAVVDGAGERVRPKLMTVATTILGAAHHVRPWDGFTSCETYRRPDGWRFGFFHSPDSCRHPRDLQSVSGLEIEA